MDTVMLRVAIACTISGQVSTSGGGSTGGSLTLAMVT